MTTAELSDRNFQRAKGVLSAEVGDEVVVMSVPHGKYFSLNGVGPRIWELLGEPISLEGLIAVLVEEYKVDECVARNETSGFLAALRERDLLVEVEGRSD